MIGLTITGGRFYPNTNLIESVIEGAHTYAVMFGEELTVHHGDCPSGADRIADQYVHRQISRTSSHDNMLHVARHPAQWKQHGRAAGPIRNKEMVENVTNLGYQKVWGAAFFDSTRTNSGTFHCWSEMNHNGIRVRVFDEHKEHNDYWLMKDSWTKEAAA